MNRHLLLLALGVALCLSPRAGYAERKVFNDDRPETKALEIWRMTCGVRTRHHTVYHDSDPFNHDGRYLLYLIGEEAAESVKKATQTLAVYDLQADREIWRSPIPARWPQWAHQSNRIFFADGVKGRRQNVWQAEIPSGRLTKICDDALNAVAGVTPDDEWLIYTLNKVYRVRARADSKSEVLWEHPEAPKVSSSLPCHSPTRPVFQVRQNVAGKRNAPDRWDRQHPARMLVDDDGRMLGPALSSLEQAHGAWRGDGEYLIAGDGLLCGRLWNQPAPVPLLAYSNSSAHDPSACGRSGQWTCTTDGINDRLKVFDWRTTDTTLVCYSCSIIHQVEGDNRDLSGPYDSDACGSPDGTKICFSSNYQLDRFPATQVTGSSEHTLEVLSTAGFPEQGLLSVHVGILSYTGKTQTAFTGIQPNALGSRFTVLREGTSVSNFLGRTDAQAQDLLAAQYATDVYLAVVRRPDRPALAARDDAIVLHPGFNHRETRGYALYVDGETVSGEPWDPRQPLTLPQGKQLQAAAVEWCGLRSELSPAMPLGTGARVLRYDPQRPAELDAPRQRLMVVGVEGKLSSAPRGATVQGLPQAAVQFTTGDGQPLAEEYYERGRLQRRHELTPDGRTTLIQEYQEGRLSKRTIRDPEERLLRIEHLDPQGYLTKCESFSRGRLSSWIEYRDREPATRTVFTAKGKEIGFENRNGVWERVR